ncbi:MAG: RdgB/HAM1 family non-canonical purine NTP pyrophosphatase [Clostridia bacterium]|nr:RdgB/HAM1 family non-canonical purine NTP pyrophosphatase [Clostridia bacterium]
MKIAVATGNKNKLREIREIIGECGNEIISVESLLGERIEVEETGDTFAENAMQKAQAAQNALYKRNIYDYAVFADDSGLCVDALNGMPGVISARYFSDGKANCTDEQNRAKLLKRMEGISQREAYFVSCFVALMGDFCVTAEGITKGRILTEECGSSGFAYDCLFYSFDLSKCFGEATAEEKNTVSHRARALKKLKEKLSNQNCSTNQ